MQVPLFSHYVTGNYKPWSICVLSQKPPQPHHRLFSTLIFHISTDNRFQCLYTSWPPHSKVSPFFQIRFPNFALFHWQPQGFKQNLSKPSLCFYHHFCRSKPYQQHPFTGTTAFCSSYLLNRFKLVAESKSNHATIYHGLVRKLGFWPSQQFWIRLFGTIIAKWCTGFGRAVGWRI